MKRSSYVIATIKPRNPNPVFAKHMEYDVYELIDPSTNYCVYSEFMSAQFAW